ncbi:hypothetical protein D5086_027516 [Populus alba]|uniref:Uncharacterized protein n=1 Tax=Populus alba TaxID=43335 RepID=A0ACC4AVL3_POPAL
MNFVETGGCERLSSNLNSNQAKNEDGIYELRKGDFSIEVTNFGATLLPVVLPDKNGKLEDTVLGFDPVDEYKAKPLSKPPPVNLALHAYWNLGGHNSGDIFSHTIQLFGYEVTPVDEIVNVKDTPYDFHQAREIGSLFNQLPDGYDINYVLDDLNPGHFKKIVNPGEVYQNIMIYRFTAHQSFSGYPARFEI